MKIFSLGFFLKYYLRQRTFLCSVKCSSGHQSFSHFRFSGKSQSQQNYQKLSLILQYSFAQKTSLILRISTHLKLKIISFRNTAKSLSDIKIFNQLCLCLVSENVFICTASFLDAQEPHSLSSLKANVCIFLYISGTVILFHRRSKLLSSGGRWLGVRQNNFLQVGRCSDLINVLQFLILI